MGWDSEAKEDCISAEGRGAVFMRTIAASVHRLEVESVHIPGVVISSQCLLFPFLSCAHEHGMCGGPLDTESSRHVQVSHASRLFVLCCGETEGHGDVQTQLNSIST